MRVKGSFSEAPIAFYRCGVPLRIEGEGKQSSIRHVHWLIVVATPAAPSCVQAPLRVSVVCSPFSFPGPLLVFPCFSWYHLFRCICTDVSTSALTVCLTCSGRSGQARVICLKSSYSCTKSAKSSGCTVRTRCSVYNDFNRLPRAFRCSGDSFARRSASASISGAICTDT